jgi:hypothetical protein
LGPRESRDRIEVILLEDEIAVGRAAGPPRIQRAKIGWGLRRDEAALLQENLADEVERLHSAGRDQHVLSAQREIRGADTNRGEG